MKINPLMSCFAILLLVASCSRKEIAFSDGTVYKSNDFLTNRNYVTSEVSEGGSHLGPLSALTNQAAKTRTISPSASEGQPLIAELITPGGGSFREYGIQDQSTGIADVGDTGVNLLFISEMSRIWRDLINGSFSSIDNSTEADVQKKALDSLAPSP